MNRTNQEWMQDLTSSGEAQEAAITDLWGILLKAALFFFSRNQGDMAGMSREEVLQRAEDCTQDALLAVLQHLQDFRGDSKFTTWAYKFAINIALMAARRERWKGISLDSLTEDGESNLAEWISLGRQDDSAPELQAIQNEMTGVIREVIAEELSDNQRKVIILMIFNEVPMDEVVRYLGTNRNSIYKMLHDARLKIKNSLLQRGIEVSEALAMFSPAK